MPQADEPRSARWERELAETGRVVLWARRRRVVIGLLILSSTFIALEIAALSRQAWLPGVVTLFFFGGMASPGVYALATGLLDYVVDAEGIGWRTVTRIRKYPWSDVADLRCEWIWWNSYGPIQIVLTRRAWADYLDDLPRYARRTAISNQRRLKRPVVVSPEGPAHSKEVVDWLKAKFSIGYGPRVAERGEGYAGTPAP